MKRTIILAITCVIFFFNSNSAQAFNIERRVEVSREVFADRMRSEMSIPREVLEKAQCIASMRSIKAGFIFGGEASTGLVSCRVNGEWGSPSFLNIGGVDYGFLVGGQVVDTILVFMTPLARRLVNRAQLQIGVDLEVAAGPVGAGGGVIPIAPVLTYSSGRGLFAGLSLKGVLMSHGTQRNFQVYGNRTPEQILETPGTFSPEIVTPFIDVLEQYAR